MLSFSHIINNVTDKKIKWGINCKIDDVKIL